MPRLMRCIYCGCLQDEPAGIKACARCGGELDFTTSQPATSPNYLQVQMELDQITAPADRRVERHLVLTLRTPAQVPAAEAAPTQTGRPALMFVSVLDVSGSMRGDKLDWTKKAVRQAVQNLQAGDLTALVTFNSRVETLLPPTPVDGNLRQRLDAILDDLNAGGMTALCGGLEAGIAAARQEARDTRLVLLLSDGQANIGEIDLEKVGLRALEAAQQKITVSALGVGHSYNEGLLSEIATQGGGRFYHLKNAQQIAPYMAGELGEASTLAARDVTLHLHLPPGASLNPLSAAYHVKEVAQVQLGDIPADTTLEVVIQLRLPAQTAGGRLKFEGRLTYTSPAGHALEAELNPVTLRVVENQQFSFRDGAVKPVVERVLGQMQASGVMQTAREVGRSRPEQKVKVDQVTQASVNEVKQYASLLGDMPAQALAEEYKQTLDQMQTDSEVAKVRVGEAHVVQRSAKKFS